MISNAEHRQPVHSTHEMIVASHFIINTLLQRGVGVWWRGLNRFSGFRQRGETVEIGADFVSPDEFVEICRDEREIPVLICSSSQCSDRSNDDLLSSPTHGSDEESEHARIRACRLLWHSLRRRLNGSRNGRTRIQHECGGCKNAKSKNRDC